MRKNRLAAAVVLVVSVTSAVSQPSNVPPVPPGTGASAQPRSGLGKQASPQAVAPSSQAFPQPEEVIEQSITAIEGSQLTDEQMGRLKALHLRKERQKATPYAAPSKPVTRTHIVNLDPGVSPPIIRTSRGQITTVVFSDANGNPWMIKDVKLNRTQFSDGRGSGQGGGDAQQEPTNVLSIEPLGLASFGNVSVQLKGLSTPVIYVLAAAQQEVDLRVDAKIPGRNPDAQDSISYATAPGIDVSLPNFLDGVPPKDAKRLRVTGLKDTEAWMYQDGLYVRTDADVQYPAFFSSARSTSGKAVYRFNSRQNSVTLLSMGRAVTVFIED
jgi:intracellular multiplication protein IcmK